MELLISTAASFHSSKCVDVIEYGFLEEGFFLWFVFVVKYYEEDQNCVSWNIQNIQLFQTKGKKKYNCLNKLKSPGTA